MLNPVKLTPSLRERVWGRTRLAPWYPDTDRPIGESWFLSELDLPLLVKLIFTSERLSVQVHPGDGEDGPRGKTEMWHILEAEPGAAIAMGFREPITLERLWDATRTGEIERLVRWVPVTAGETYFIPAHTVHAIGGGIVLVEIQQNSDVTYRLWDYNRGREIHVDKGVPICDLDVHPGASQGPVRSKYFVAETVRLQAGGSVKADSHHCHLWICIAGEGAIGSAPVKAGEVWLLPEGKDQPAVQTPAGATFLTTWAPAK